MSINIVDINSNVDYLYCDMCRYGDCISMFAQFKHCNGWYCRNCYELVDEDADEEDDNNFVITLNMLRVNIKTSSPLFDKMYYNMKQVCREINMMGTRQKIK